MKIFGCGDLFVAKRLPRQKYSGYTELVSLMQAHEVCFGNLETTVHNNEGYPSMFPGGGYAMASPLSLMDLKEMGFNVVNLANNHALDYSHKGLEATLRHLDEAGLVRVGGGINLIEASMPGYVECREGRVAFIGCTSSFHDSDAAGPQGGMISGRPGVNPLRRIEYYEVTGDLYESLCHVAEETGMNDGHKWSIANGYREESKELFLREMKFVKAEQNRRVTHPLSKDMERITRSIEEAKIQSDCVVVTFHSHQMNGSSEIPAEFILEFCHSCIDAGANVVFGHGAHEIQGLEIFKGCPIFYGMGDFILHNEMQFCMPYEFYEKVGQEKYSYDFVGLAMNKRSKGQTRGLQADHKAWESIAASVDFSNGKVSGICIYPIELGFHEKRSMRGWPSIDKTGKVLQYFCDLSNKQYGTEFTIEDNRAIVQLK